MQSDEDPTEPDHAGDPAAEHAPGAERGDEVFAPPPPQAGPPPPQAPPPPPQAGPMPQPGPRRLTRSRDRKVAGVAGGIAEYLGIDPTLVRLGFLLAIFVGGAGVIAYVVAWIVLPEQGPGNPGGRPPMRVLRDGPGVGTITALAIGLFVLAVVFGLTVPDGGGVLVPLAMIAGGIWLLSQRESSAPSITGADADTAGFSPAWSSAGDAATTSRFQAAATGSAPPGWDQPTTPWEQPPTDWSWPATDPAPTPAPEPRRRATVTRVTVSLLALLAAGAIAANELDLFDVSAPAVLAVALVGVGAGAIVSAFVGRGRGLIPIGLLLVVAFAGAATAQPLIDDGTGERSYRPTSAAEVRDEYRLGVGELDIDLSDLDIAPGTTVETTVDLGIGSAVILVPADATVIVDGDVGIGDLRIFEFEENGFGNELRTTRAIDVDDGSSTPTTIDDIDRAEPGGELIIHLEVGMGEGVVRNG